MDQDQKDQKSSPGLENLENLSPPSKDTSFAQQASSVIIQPQAASTCILIHQNMRKYPVVMTCPFCKETIKTKVKRRVTEWLCCTTAEKELLHSCPSCGAYLATYDN